MSMRNVFSWDYDVAHRWVLSRGWTHYLADALPMYRKGDSTNQYRLGDATKIEMLIDLEDRRNF